MDLYQIVAVLLFVAGYIFITLEHKLQTNKSAIALALGGILWIVVALSTVGSEDLQHHLEEAGTEIFNIIAFLLAAMTLVEILVHYRFFDLIRQKLARLKLRDRGQFYVIGVLTFFLSAVLDNLTITIVMIQIARQFFGGKNLIIAAAGIVILANAGGAWSPIGDVTTIMIWLAEKFTASQIITQGFLPALALGLVSALLLGRQVADTATDYSESAKIELTRGEKAIIGTALLSFSFPLIMNFIDLQPYIGLLFGLGLVWMMIEFVKVRSYKETHLTANIDELIKRVDIPSLKFFIGILLAVSALGTLGILEQLSHVLFGEAQEVNRLIIGNVIIGLASAIVDNVPLTALSIDIIATTDPRIWVLLALAVGTGGSALVIGSVAGVVAMGMVKELTFGKYLKIATIPALVGYVVGMAVWLLQFYIIG